MADDPTDVTTSEAEAADLSRRSFIGRAFRTAMLGAGALAVGAGAASAKAKVSKTAARYQTHPNKKQRCGTCTHFLFGGCEIVAGSISSSGWCKFYKAS